MSNSGITLTSTFNAQRVHYVKYGQNVDMLHNDFYQYPPGEQGFLCDRAQPVPIAGFTLVPRPVFGYVKELWLRCMYQCCIIGFTCVSLKPVICLLPVISKSPPFLILNYY